MEKLKLGRYKKKHEQFQDTITHVFPELFKGGNESDNTNKKMCRTITFQVTDRCNLACTYCYQINKSTRRMSFETAKKFIDLLLSGDKGMSTYINPTISPFIILEFIGGEPFLEVELMDQIIDYFISEATRLHHPWASRFMISTCSNGVLYRDPRVQRFLNKYHMFISFSVTLDGNKDLHDQCRVFPDGRGSYDLAYDACMDWMNKGYDVGSKITISPDNVKYTYEAIRHMYELGYDNISANCVFEEGWNNSHALTLYEEMKKLADYMIENDCVELSTMTLFDEYFFRPMNPERNDNWCGGTGLMIAVDPDGYIYPCIRYMESSLGNDMPPLRIGDVNNGIASCKEHCDTISCLTCITRRSQSTDECFNCPIADGCAWCSGYNYQVYGTPNKRATFICIMHKARALGTAYLYSRWYELRYPEKMYQLHIPKSMALEVISEEEYEFLISSPNIEIEENKKEGENHETCVQ